MREPVRHPAIDAFLERLDARVRPLPAADREEIAQHLDLLVEAARVGGLDQEAAVRRALARFGSVERLGAALARPWWRDRRVLRGLARLLAWQLPLGIGTSYALHALDGAPMQSAGIAVLNALVISLFFIRAVFNRRRTTGIGTHA
jgi:hypothetical protein